jgi:hypothetical protein
MEWVLAASGLLIFFIYILVKPSCKKAINILSRELQLNPSVIDSFINNINPRANAALGNMSRQQCFCNYVLEAEQDKQNLEPLIQIFFIYQAMKNPHPLNIELWEDKLAEHGFQTDISNRTKDLATTFINAEYLAIHDFIDDYNNSKIAGVSKTKADDNVNTFNSLSKEPTISPQVVLSQLALASIDVKLLEGDNFALGYLFGCAEMEYFQKGGDLEEQSSATQFIFEAIFKVSPHNQLDLSQKSMSLQGDPVFEKGRKTGAQELEELVKKQGSYSPIELFGYVSNVQS